jgi:hypothetical protein
MPEDFHHVRDRLLRRTLAAAPETFSEPDLRAALSKTVNAVAHDIRDPDLPGPELARRIDAVEVACEEMKRGSMPGCHAALRRVWSDPT